MTDQELKEGLARIDAEYAEEMRRRGNTLYKDGSCSHGYSKASYACPHPHTHWDSGPNPFLNELPPGS